MNTSSRTTNQHYYHQANLVNKSTSSSSSFINTFIGGIPHSKSSTNVDSISGNIGDNTASAVSANHAVINNRIFKITKSTSSFSIKENQLQQQTNNDSKFKKCKLIICI